MLQLLLEPAVLFFGFVMLSCALCAACLSPLLDLTRMSAPGPRYNRKQNSSQSDEENATFRYIDGDFSSATQDFELPRADDENILSLRALLTRSR
jgi:hypothetical protein